VRRHLVGDHLIVDWKDAGLLFPSVATGILRTVTRGMVDRDLGAMAKGIWTPPHTCCPPEGAGDPVINCSAFVDGGWDV
jgi:hypothetical protein